MCVSLSVRERSVCLSVRERSVCLSVRYGGLGWGLWSTGTNRFFSRSRSLLSSAEQGHSQRTTNTHVGLETNNTVFTSYERLTTCSLMSNTSLENNDKDNIYLYS